MTAHPDIADHQDWTKTDLKYFQSTMDGIDRVDRLLAANPGRTDRQIARWAKSAEYIVTARRLIRAGAVPNTSHGNLIRLLAFYASEYGFERMIEHSFRVDGRRHMPDLVVLDQQRVRWVVEVKSELRHASQIARAVAQAKRYRAAVGDGLPVVTAYRVDERRVDGVWVCSASTLRAEMRRSAPSTEVQVAA